MKKSLILAAAMLVQMLSMPVFAAENDNFTVLKVKCDIGQNAFDAGDYDTYDKLVARYADDKTPIAFSSLYDGYMCAAVPTENADRGIEYFISEDKTFNDDPGEENDDGYLFYLMGQLAKRGVISGDNYGNALPHNNVTRAEATAMVMRMMGYGNFDDADSGFDDVPKDSWYAQTVTAARKIGIVSGDSKTEFNPHRNVSREEITAMAARAVVYAGMRNNIEEPEKYLAENVNPADIDDISDWAMNSYAILTYQTIMDYDYIDNGNDVEPTDLIYFKPKQPATRGETAELLWHVVLNDPVFPSETAIKYGFDKGMPIIDGSTSTYPFTDAIYSTLFNNGYTHPQKPLKHSKSHASYQRLINGEVDVIIASVYPAEDIIQMAKDKNVELEMIPIAYDAMVFFTNKDNSAEGLTMEQISDIYVDNKYKNWSELGGPDALLYPYCRNNDSGSHAQMQRHFLNGKEINETIRRESTSVAMADVLTDVMGAQTDNPLGYGLGYSIFYYYNNMNYFINTFDYLKLLSIDGVYPTDETIADGSYPLSNNTYIVFRADEPEDSKARKLADFMLTPLGQQCVEYAGFGPLEKSDE